LAYCTIEDLRADFPEEWLAQTSDDDVGAYADETVVGKAIAHADADIDMWLADVCTVPFAVVPDAVKYISAELAFYYLYRRRFNNQVPDWVREMRNEAENRLAKIKAGELSLGEVAEQSTAAAVTNKTADDRMFTSDVLDGFFEAPF